MRKYHADPADEVNNCRPITWQRTTDMFGLIGPMNGASWEQIQDALADDRYYRDDEDGLLYLYDNDSGPIAVIWQEDQREDSEDGLVLGEA